MPNFEDISALCTTRFNAQIVDTDSVDEVIYDNAPTDTPQVLSKMWVRFHVEFFGNTVVGIAGDSNRYRVEGNCRARCSVRIGTGQKRVLELADKIVDAFRGLQDGGVLFWVPRVQPVGRDDNWWMLDVICPFTADRVA